MQNYRRKGHIINKLRLSLSLPTVYQNTPKDLLRPIVMGDNSVLVLLDRVLLYVSVTLIWCQNIL